LKGYKKLKQIQKDLSEYSGEDKVVSAQELMLELNKKPESIIKLKSNIPSLDRYTEGFEEGELISISGPTKSGKCHGKGTKILMFDGSIKEVQDIKVGDKLMGDDSTSRSVLSISNGIDNLYKIIPWQGDSYSINSEHILCLQRTKSTNRKPDNPSKIIHEISLKKYIGLSKTQKHLLKTYRVPVNFPDIKLPVDPYLLGIWLGDGTSTQPEITSSDIEISKYLHEWAIKNNFKITTKSLPNNRAKTYRICEITQKGRIGRRNINRFLEVIKKLNLIKNKYIPHIFKCNSEKNRLDLLAGIIDTDGSNAKGTRSSSVELIFKSKQLADDIVFLGRSLGFCCTIHSRQSKIKKINFVGTYWRISISGNIGRIPCKIKYKVFNGKPTFKNVLRASFCVEDYGWGEYFGFVLDKNGRYLLGDFQVTHNTLLCQSLTHQFIRQQYSPLWFSFEVTTKQFLKQFDDIPMIFMPSKLKAHALDWFEDRVYESFQKYHTRIIFIDHLHYLIDLARIRNASIEIGQIIRRLKTLAVSGDFVIFLLCHTQKGASEETLSYESIRDSSFISQESDSVFMIKRIPDKGETRARLFVEFHRRTGILQKKVELIKVKNYLVELEENIDYKMKSAGEFENGI